MDIANIESKKYAGFFVRALSGIFDWAIFLLFLLINFMIVIIMKRPPKNYFIFIQVITILFKYIYNIFIPQKYSGTLGKLIFKIRILKLNNQKIGLKESFFRYLINFLWDLCISIITINIIINTSDELYNDFNTFKEWNNYLSSSEPKYLIILTILINLWIFSEYFVLLLNKKKRGLQDYIAGTIVVNTKYYNEI